MTPTALIIQRSVLDTQVFLGACIEMLGYSPARSPDAHKLEEMAHSLSCLTAFKNRDATPGVKESKNVFELFSIGCLIIADEQDMQDILEVAGLPFVFTETTARGIQAAVVSGTLRQWRTAILKGCDKNAAQYVRICYDTIYLQFRSIGLDGVFERSQKILEDNTFLLQ